MQLLQDPEEPQAVLTLPVVHMKLLQQKPPAQVPFPVLPHAAVQVPPAPQVGVPFLQVVQVALPTPQASLAVPGWQSPPDEQQPLQI